MQKICSYSVEYIPKYATVCVCVCREIPEVFPMLTYSIGSCIVVSCIAVSCLHYNVIMCAYMLILMYTPSLAVVMIFIYNAIKYTNIELGIFIMQLLM